MTTADFSDMGAPQGWKGAQLKHRSVYAIMLKASIRIGTELDAGEYGDSS
jgi:hypothetical protein